MEEISSFPALASAASCLAASRISQRPLELRATISVTPGEQTIAVQADGSFELELAPGKYTLEFEHPEFGSQQRKIHVVDRGVVILNIALVR